MMVIFALQNGNYQRWRAIDIKVQQFLLISIEHNMESIAKFMLYSLKQIPPEILNSANNQEPDPCYVCNAPILQQVFNKNLALILLPCGHIHHDKCIRTLSNSSRCPFPYCTEIIESSVTNFTNMQTMQTMNIQQTNITNIQTIQQQPQETFQGRLERYRGLNSRLLGNENIQVIPNQLNKYPQNFPTSVSQLRRLTGPSVDTFLEFYGLPKHGLVKDKRERLAEYIGITKYL